MLEFGAFLGGEIAFDKTRQRFYISPDLDGVVAQLVERLNGIQEVRGSNPLGSTILLSLSSS